MVTFASIGKRKIYSIKLLQRNHHIFYRSFLSFPYTLKSSFIKTHHETKVVPFTCAEMYNVVSDVNKYQEFLPFCKESNVLWTKENEIVNGMKQTILNATLTVGFQYFHEAYTSHVTLVYPKHVIVRSIESPSFKRIESEWKFQPAGSSIASVNECIIEFRVTFEVTSQLHAKAMEYFFQEVAKTQLKAFIDRATTLKSYREAKTHKERKDMEDMFKNMTNSSIITFQTFLKGIQSLKSCNTSSNQYKWIKNGFEFYLYLFLLPKTFNTKDGIEKFHLTIEECTKGIVAMNANNNEDIVAFLFDQFLKLKERDPNDGTLCAMDFIQVLQSRLVLAKHFFPAYIQNQRENQALSSKESPSLINTPSELEMDMLLQAMEKEVPPAVYQLFEMLNLSSTNVHKSEWCAAWYETNMLEQLSKIDFDVFDVH